MVFMTEDKMTVKYVTNRANPNSGSETYYPVVHEVVVEKKR